MDQSRFIRGLLDDPADPQQPQYVPANDFGPRAYGLLNTLFPDPNVMVGDAIKQYRGGDAVGAFETMFGAIPATGALKAAPKAAGIIAYHGSPHSFDKFDLSKIGTGEGAQAYGHGLYFAESEPVAKAYRDNLSGKNSPLSQAIFKGGKEIPWYEMTADERKLLPILTDAGGDLAKAQEIVRSDFLPSAHDRLSAELERISQQGYELKPHGSMYQVRINADPNAFLDWDKPLSEQSPHVLDRLGLNNSQRDFDLEAKLQYGSPEYEAYMKRIDSRVGAPHNPDVTGAEWYRDDLLRGGHEAERGRSAYLASQGIPGIKYLDQGSRPNVGHVDMLRQQLATLKSRSASQAAIDNTQRALDEAEKSISRNYVVFDDSLIDILKKYGLIGLLGGGAAASGVSGMNTTPSMPNSAPGL